MRIQKPVGQDEIEALVRLSTEEERAFFVRNPHLVEFYGDRLILVALCQGAALQFLGRGNGVKDFDVHFFYAKNPDRPRVRSHSRLPSADVGSFSGVAVDFLRAIVPEAQPPERPEEAVDTVREYLTAGRTVRARKLVKKAVIGLMPKEILGKKIWPRD